MDNLKRLEFGDGEDDGTDVAHNLSIKSVSNGYLVTVESDEGVDEYVYADKRVMFNEIINFI